MIKINVSQTISDEYLIFYAYYARILIFSQVSYLHVYSSEKKKKKKKQIIVYVSKNCFFKNNLNSFSDSKFLYICKRIVDRYIFIVYTSYI